MASANMPLVYGGGRRGIMGTSASLLYPKSESRADDLGVVSQATLEAGGHVHGIVPRALMTRASERTSAPTVNPVAGSGGASQDKEKVQSAEGAGEDLVDSDYDGRMTLSVVDSMHEVSLRDTRLGDAPDHKLTFTAQDEDGTTQYRRVHCPSRRVRDVRRSTRDDHLEPAQDPPAPRRNP